MTSYEPEWLKDLSDEALVRRFQHTGETRCFDEIWRRHSGPVYSRCLRFLRNPVAAEDVTAEVFLKIAVHVGDYRQQNFKGWMFTVARHACINHVKQAAERFRGGSADDLDVAAPCDHAAAIEIESVLQQLSAAQRIAIKLFYVNRYSYEEIAALQDWTLKEVKTHLQNGRRMFKQLWDRAAHGREA